MSSTRLREVLVTGHEVTYPSPPCGCFSLRTTAARTGKLREWDPGATPAPATAAGEVAPSWKSRPTQKTPTWWVQHRIQDIASTAWNCNLGLPNYFMDSVNSSSIINHILFRCWLNSFFASCKESACGQEQSQEYNNNNNNNVCNSAVLRTVLHYAVLVNRPVIVRRVSFRITVHITDSMEQAPYWEATSDSRSARQKIPRYFWNPHVHCRTSSSPPVVFILNQMNPVHALTPCGFKIQFNGVLLPAIKIALFYEYLSRTCTTTDCLSYWTCVL